jgi:ABC-2 type transport system permease protein
MRRTFTIAGRVVRQLIRNPRLLVLSVAAPLVIVYFLKIFFDTLPPTFDVARYAVPVAAFVVHFLAFLLCPIALVQERTTGTMERMFINGFRRTEIIAGYVLGFLGLSRPSRPSPVWPRPSGSSTSTTTGIRWRCSSWSCGFWP